VFQLVIPFQLELPWASASAAEPTYEILRQAERRREDRRSGADRRGLARGASERRVANRRSAALTQRDLSEGPAAA
jgi:hypothetical protein